MKDDNDFRESTADPAAEALEIVRTYCASNEVHLAKLRRRNQFFRSEIERVVDSFIPRSSRVLDVGCGTGSLLVASRPLVGVGLDIDPAAFGTHQGAVQGNLEFFADSIEEWDPPDKKFDYVVASGLLEHVYDAGRVLSKIANFCHQESRVVTVTYSRLWQPLLKLAEVLRLKSDFPIQNWIPKAELVNIARQSELELVTTRPAVLFPIRIPLLSRAVNRWIAPLPIIRHLSFANICVFRPKPERRPISSVSVVIPARNESGHIQEILRRLPKLAPNQEVILVEGNSTDDTWDEIQRVVRRISPAYHSELVVLQQRGRGKGDAVRTGFALAQGEILLILDADISVPPEELPKFINVLESGVAEFANGSRLVYPMQEGAMRFLNLLGNKFFGSLFTFLLGQQVRDTLCGTKVLWRHDYERLSLHRERFGALDPFGDFDLLFGATGLSLRIVDVPVHYLARSYGSTNISRFRHGWLLLRMSWLAARRLRFV